MRRFRPILALCLSLVLGLVAAATAAATAGAATEPGGDPPPGLRAIEDREPATEDRDDDGDGTPRDRTPRDRTPGDRTPGDRGDRSGGRIDVAAMQVCGVDDYDDGDRQCSTDAAGTAVRTEALYCTAIVEGSAGDEVTATFLYEGSEAYSDALVLDGRRAQPLALMVTLGPHPLPGGEWECEITGDATERVDVRTSGPSGEFLHAGVCATVDAVELTDEVDVCPPDERSTRFRTVESVTCSAVLTDVADRPVRLEVEYEGTFEVRGREVDGWRDHRTFRVDPPVASAYVAVDGQAMTGRAGSNLPAGDYTCRWLVEGDELGSQRFVVAGRS